MDRLKLLTILFALLGVHHLEFAEAQITNNDIPACSGIFDFYFIIDRLAVHLRRISVIIVVSYFLLCLGKRVMMRYGAEAIVWGVAS